MTVLANLNGTDLLLGCFRFKVLCGCHFIGAVDNYPVTRSEMLSYFLGGFIAEKFSCGNIPFGSAL